MDAREKRVRNRALILSTHSSLSKILLYEVRGRIKFNATMFSNRSLSFLFLSHVRFSPSREPKEFVGKQKTIPKKTISIRMCILST
jgi:hypothetical protein